jgi:hypothetical protein
MAVGRDTENIQHVLDVYSSTGLQGLSLFHNPLQHVQVHFTLEGLLENRRLRPRRGRRNADAVGGGTSELR